MIVRSLTRSVAQVAVGVALGYAMMQAIDAGQSPVWPAMPKETPTPCVVRAVDLSHPALANHTIACAAADATATAYIMVLVTATPCDRWEDKNLTPIPGPPPSRFMAPCAVVAHDATWTAIDATKTAGIIDGSYYGLHVSSSAPKWTPTIFTYGTVPMDVLAGYPLTLTALPVETPVGWRLDGDTWVVDARRNEARP